MKSHQLKNAGLWGMALALSFTCLTGLPALAQKDDSEEEQTDPHQSQKTQAKEEELPEALKSVEFLLKLQGSNLKEIIKDINEAPEGKESERLEEFLSSLNE